MTDNDIIKALECCEAPSDFYCRDCPLIFEDCHKIFLALINSQKAEIERLEKFKSYFDKLYGEGLEVANWHLNGDLEPFDNFYESALDV